MKPISFSNNSFTKIIAFHLTTNNNYIRFNYHKLNIKRMNTTQIQFQTSPISTKTNIDFLKLFQGKDYNNIFEKLCNRSSILGKEEEIFRNYFKVVNELVKQGQGSLICDFYGSIVKNENLIFRNKEYIFLIFERSIPFFQSNVTLNSLGIESLVKVLQFFILQKSYINNNFYFNLINTISTKLVKNEPMSLQCVVNIVSLSKELRYFHFKLIDFSVIRFLEMKQLPEASDLFKLIEALTFLNSKPNLTKIIKSEKLYSKLLNMEDTMIKLQIISMLVLSNSINSEQTLSLLGNCEKLDLKKSKEVSYLKFIILVLKIYNKELKEYDKLINFKFSHIEPFKIRNHYNVQNLDYFNFFKYYFITHFINVFPQFSVEFDYSVLDIFIVPIRLKRNDFNYFIELGAEDSYLKNYNKILNGFDAFKHFLMQKYFTDNKIKFKLILIENYVLYEKNLEEKINTMDLFFKEHLI
jgi:hypothetical protein